MRAGLVFLLLAACGGSAPPAKIQKPKAAAPAPARRGPFAVDAAGRWTPTTFARARLSTPGGVPELIGFDASPELTALAVRHAGPLLLDGVEVAPAGVTVLAFDAEGKRRWLRKVRMDIRSLRVGPDGSVAYGGTGLALGEGPMAGQEIPMYAVAKDGEAEAYATTFPEALERGAITAAYPLTFERVLFAGSHEVTGKRVVEPFQGVVGRQERTQAQPLSVGTPAQLFGGDHAFLLERVEPGPEDWWFVLGTYQGNFGGGGRAAPLSAVRSAFVAGLTDEDGIEWIIGLPGGEASREVSVPAAFSDDTGLHVLIAGRGEALTLSGVHMTTRLALGGNCSHLRAAAGSELRSADLEGDLVGVVGSFTDLELGAKREKTRAAGAFLDRKCGLLAAFDLDGRALGVRFSGEDVVLAAEQDGVLQVTWSRP